MSEQKNWMDAIFESKDGKGEIRKNVLNQLQEDIENRYKNVDSTAAEILEVIAKHPMSLSEYEDVMRIVDKKVKAASNVAV